MKIVIDTNVFIAAVLSPSGSAKRVLDVCLSGEVDFALSAPIVAEIGRVLHKPKISKMHRWTDGEISQFIRDLSDVAEYVPGTTAVEASPDPKDNMIFACALEANADYIVSGDAHHVLSVGAFQGIVTLRPPEFLALLPKLKQAA